MSKRLIKTALAVPLLVGLTLPASAADSDTLKVESKHLTPEQIAEFIKDLLPRPPLPEYPGGGAKDGDITPPYLEITSIDIGTDYASFEWYAEDETTDPEYLFYYWGLAYYCGDYGYNVLGDSFTSLPPGYYTFYVLVEDWSYNQSGEYYPFEIEEPPPPDTTPPSLEITDFSIGTNSATFYWNATDDSPPIKYYYGLQGVSSFSGYSITSKTFSSLSAGNYTFYVYAEDSTQSHNQSPTLYFPFVIDDDNSFEVGGIYNADYQYELLWPDVPTQNITEGFVEYLENYSLWEQNFIYGNVDEEDPFTDNDNQSADGVDLFFYAGHGGEDYIPLVDSGWPVSHTVDYLEAQWGETDVEWVMLFACYTLMGDDAEADNHQKSNGKFAQALDGVHMICGATTPMSAANQYAGEYIAAYLANGYSVGSAWFLGCALTQPIGTRLRIIYEEEKYFNPSTQEADFIWGTGYTLPDEDPDDDYYSYDCYLE